MQGDKIQKEKGRMEIKEVQREVRTVYIGGAVGQAVSGTIWLVSAILATWVNQRYGIYVLVLGGMFIFPLTQLVLKLMGRKTTLSKGNPYTALAMQTAFIVPLLIPVIAGAALYEINWFYPAFMMVVGVHYMPFMTLYGMRLYGALAAVLIVAGLMIGMYFAESFVLGGWITAVVLLIFSILLWISFKKENL